MFHAGKNQGALLKQDIDAPKQPNCVTYYLLISDLIEDLITQDQISRDTS